MKFYIFESQSNNEIVREFRKAFKTKKDAINFYNNWVKDIKETQTPVEHCEDLDMCMIAKCEFWDENGDIGTFALYKSSFNKVNKTNIVAFFNRVPYSTNY